MRRLTLPVPPSGNDYWRVVNGRVVESRKAREYKERIRGLVTARPLAGRVVLSGVIYLPGEGDLDNRLKVLGDALELLAYLNDGQIKRIRDLSIEENSASPRAELLLVGQRWATPDEIQAATLAREARRKRKPKPRIEDWNPNTEKAPPRARPAFIAPPKGGQS